MSPDTIYILSGLYYLLIGLFFVNSKKKKFI